MMAQLAKALERAARRVRESTEERDSLIRELNAGGMSLRAIAAKAELSHTAIAKIVARS